MLLLLLIKHKSIFCLFLIMIPTDPNKYYKDVFTVFITQYSLMSLSIPIHVVL